MRRSETIVLAVLGLLALGGIVWAAGSLKTDAAIAERLEVIRGMSPQDKSRLQANQQRFERLSPDEQQRLRALQAKLESGEAESKFDVNELSDVLDRYDQWLSDLSLTNSTEIRGLPPEKRIDKIKNLRKQELQSRIEKQLREEVLTDKDWKAIRGWWADFVRRNEKQLVAKLPPKMRETLSKLPPEKRVERLQMLVLIQRKKLPRGKPAIKPTTKEIEQLIGSLSQTARDRLRQIDASDARLTAISQWVQTEAKRRGKKAIAPYVDPAELKKFHDKQLSSEQRARLAKLSPDKRRRELAKLYVRSKAAHRRPPGSRPPDFDRPRPESRPESRPGPRPGHRSGQHSGNRPGPHGPPGRPPHDRNADGDSPGNRPAPPDRPRS